MLLLALRWSCSMRVIIAARGAYLRRTPSSSRAPTSTRPPSQSESPRTAPMSRPDHHETTRRVGRCRRRRQWHDFTYKNKYNNGNTMRQRRSIMTMGHNHNDDERSVNSLRSARRHGLRQVSLARLLATCIRDTFFSLPSAASHLV